MLFIAGEHFKDSVVFNILESDIEEISLNIYYINNLDPISIDIFEIRNYRLSLDDYNRIVVENLPEEDMLVFCWYSNYNKVLSTHVLKFNIKSIAFVSCDLPAADTKNNLWSNISDDVPQLVCHLGDNIYGDSVYHGRGNYPQLYYDSWSRWSFNLLHSFHLMIPDDHDITDGFEYKDYNQITAKGLECYVMYQEALFLHPENHQKGVYFKIFNEDQDNEFSILFISRICTNQLSIIKSYSDLFTSRVILAFSSAPIPITNRLYNFVFGSNGWSKENLIDLYDYCFSLDSNIIIIGGDIHIGVEGNIVKEEKIIPIYITSPISNQPTPPEFIAAKTINNCKQLGSYQLDFKAKAKRNYLSFDSETFTGKLIYDKKSLPKSKINLIKEAAHMIGLP